MEPRSDDAGSSPKRIKLVGRVSGSQDAASLAVKSEVFDRSHGGDAHDVESVNEHPEGRRSSHHHPKPCRLPRGNVVNKALIALAANGAISHGTRDHLSSSFCSDSLNAAVLAFVLRKTSFPPQLASFATVAFGVYGQMVDSLSPAQLTEFDSSLAILTNPASRAPPPPPRPPLRSSPSGSPRTSSANCSRSTSSSMSLTDDSHAQKAQSIDASFDKNKSTRETDAEISDTSPAESSDTSPESPLTLPPSTPTSPPGLPSPSPTQRLSSASPEERLATRPLFDPRARVSPSSSPSPPPSVPPSSLRARERLSPSCERESAIGDDAGVVRDGAPSLVSRPNTPENVPESSESLSQCSSLSPAPAGDSLSTVSHDSHSLSSVIVKKETFPSDVVPRELHWESYSQSRDRNASICSSGTIESLPEHDLPSNVDSRGRRTSASNDVDRHVASAASAVSYVAEEKLPNAANDGTFAGVSCQNVVNNSTVRHVPKDVKLFSIAEIPAASTAVSSINSPSVADITTESSYCQKVVGMAKPPPNLADSSQRTSYDESCARTCTTVSTEDVDSSTMLDVATDEKLSNVAIVAAATNSIDSRPLAITAEALYPPTKPKANLADRSVSSRKRGRSDTVWRLPPPRGRQRRARATRVVVGMTQAPPNFADSSQHTSDESVAKKRRFNTNDKVDVISSATSSTSPPPQGIRRRLRPRVADADGRFHAKVSASTKDLPKLVTEVSGCGKFRVVRTTVVGTWKLSKKRKAHINDVDSKENPPGATRTADAVGSDPPGAALGGVGDADDKNSDVEHGESPPGAAAADRGGVDGIIAMEHDEEEEDDEDDDGEVTPGGDESCCPQNGEVNGASNGKLEPDQFPVDSITMPMPGTVHVIFEEPFFTVLFHPRWSEVPQLQSVL